MTDEEVKELWQRAQTIFLSTLQSAEEKNQSERYLSSITSISRQGDTLVVYASSSFAANLLETNYSEKFRSCLTLAGDQENLALVFKCDSSPHTTVPVTDEYASAANRTTQPNKDVFVSTMPLNDEYTFSEFVRGPSNSWALAAAQGVVSNPGKSGYNPLFIHGGTGLGKTHLMQAIGNELKAKDPTRSICYLTAETFLNEYVNALTNGQIESFRHRYRSIDLLMVDDVQFLQKGKQFQDEFFNTFNALQQAHKQIVMTSDVAPKNLPMIEQRLISRFEGGMVQEIESPNYETRLAILKKKSEGMEPPIPQMAIEFIADTIKSHVRAMEGALRKVSLYFSMDPKAEINKDILTYLLKDFIEKEHSMRKLTIEEIQTTIAKRYSITMVQMLSTERTQSLVTPRQMAMYIARKYTTKSLPEIAKKFEKTHATILHGVKNIEKRLDVEEDLRGVLAEILAQLGCNVADKME